MEKMLRGGLNDIIGRLIALRDGGHVPAHGKTVTVSIDEPPAEDDGTPGGGDVEVLSDEVKEAAKREAADALDDGKVLEGDDLKALLKRVADDARKGKEHDHNKRPDREEERSCEVPKPNASFKQEVKRILTENVRTRYRGRQRSGMVGTRRIAHACTSDRVFHVNDDPSRREYVIDILVDTSGSMAGARMKAAAAATCALYRDLAGLAKVGVMTFNGRCIRQVGFGQPLAKTKTKTLEELRKALELECSRGTGDNHDHIAFARSVHDMRNLRGRKIVITLTDGDPCCGRGNKECDDGCGDTARMQKRLRRVISQARAYGIETIGIGIGTGHVRGLYDNVEVVSNLSRLYQAMTRQLRRVVRRLP